uniref:ENT domain-containing protein n=1 Tax=Leersia perrieri TaxID=77586 RepID=A0A0D9VDJ2_9ORYZ
MKFCKRTKVEVLQKGDAPLGSWRLAEVVSGNGHTYLVSYDSCPTHSSVAAERVPRKAMRPLPPPHDGLVCWNKGDIAEVFDSYAWKVAEVVRLLGFSCYLVRLLGSSLELEVHASNLRMRHLWEDGKWVANPKDFAKCLGGSPRNQLRCGKVGHELVHASMDIHLLLKNKKVSEGNTFQGMKRKSSAISGIPMQYNKVSKRFRKSHIDGRCLPLVVHRDPLHLMDKVDALDSLSDRANGFHKTNLAAANTNFDYRDPDITTQDSDTVSVSSVGSCDPCGSPYGPAHSQEYDCANVCSRTDDAKASVSGRESHGRNDDAEASVSGRESPPPLNDGMKEKTHLLELHAYRATLMALYASGSISWEQEAMMTNLRLTLNISTDEHLSELRNLVSS